MRLKILGAAAGGGFPQWNCGCPGCVNVRAGRIKPLTQSSIAVQAEGGDWFLINASPDVRSQLEQLRTEQTPAIRSNPIAGVILTDGEIDHTAGLVILRESDRPLQIYSTEMVQRGLSEGFPLLSTLESYCGVKWTQIESGCIFTLTTNTAKLEVEVFPLSSKPPKYMRGKSNTHGTWAVGLTFRCQNGSVITYAPVIEKLDDSLLSRLDSSDCILVDGTCWHNNELPALGITTRTAIEMGHLPLSGESGSLSILSQLNCPRKILIHINNTNPILLPDSVERQTVINKGFEIGYDGLTIEL